MSYIEQGIGSSPKKSPAINAPTKDQFLERIHNLPQDLIKIFETQRALDSVGSIHSARAAYLLMGLLRSKNPNGSEDPLILNLANSLGHDIGKLNSCKGKGFNGIGDSLNTYYRITPKVDPVSLNGDALYSLSLKERSERKVHPFAGAKSLIKMHIMDMIPTDFITGMVISALCHHEVYTNSNGNNHSYPRKNGSRLPPDQAIIVSQVKLVERIEAMRTKRSYRSNVLSPETTEENILNHFSGQSFQPSRHTIRDVIQLLEEADQFQNNDGFFNSIFSPCAHKEVVEALKKPWDDEDFNKRIDQLSEKEAASPHLTK